MKKTVMRTASALALAGLAATAALADESADLIINGEIEITIRAAAPAHMENVDEIFSGWLFRADETQVMEMDDFDNPGMIFAENGLESWDAVEGTEGKSCASCHGAIEEMAGVKAVYPKWNEAAGEVRTIQLQVNDCRENRMGAEPWKVDSGSALNMEAALATVSRGMPVNVAIDGPAQSSWELGKEIYYTRFGQLEMACANCHEDNYGNMIRADHLSQGQTNGFPLYRLKNAKINTTHGRFKGCMSNIRATPYKEGSPEFKALELYVASRGQGLVVETPAVRN